MLATTTIYVVYRKEMLVLFAATRALRRISTVMN